MNNQPTNQPTHPALNEAATLDGLACPPPIAQHARIVLGHGSGGQLSHDLIKRVFLPPFDNAVLRAGDDAGVVQANTCTRLAISTDSHVVWPLFFPGGDIGRLAVCGTVNDVAMLGARPLYLTAGFILEEGLAFDVLEHVAASMRAAASEAGVQIIAGDTKVVQKGKADGLYINTTGVGVLEAGIEIGGARAQPGDVVILSGPIGDHGIAVLSARGELGFEADVQSDVAPLNHLVAALLDASDQIHVLRDPTRGGLATTLNEIAQQSQMGITLTESSIPVRPAVQAACELLGFDPLYIANEGKLVALVGRADADRVLQVMRAARYGAEAVIIGEVQAAPARRVLVKTAFGSCRILDVLQGELLPRIC
ncbi:MAG TPA: hydrogenase expression/formation protein HypE [Anaerolineae bacterium]|nr:hydrogenase expression/formation protein HypE [Anaerolineae bacterium]